VTVHALIREKHTADRIGVKLSSAEEIYFNALLDFPQHDR
jgi:hypothetical protein